MSLKTGFRFRAVTPDQELAIAAARSAGVRAELLAAEYGCTPRSIYRAVRRAGRPRYEVVVAGHRASFQLEDGVPVQVTPWVPA